MDDHAFFTAMPKVELHVHVEGALGPDDYFDLAEKNGIVLPVKDRTEWRSRYQFRDFTHFIEIYRTSTALLKTAEDYRFILERFSALQASQNIRYTEAFMSATFMMDKDDHEVLYAAIGDGLDQGRRRYGVEVRLVPDISREVPEKQQPVADFILEGARRGIFIGAGLGGLENGFPVELFKESFERIRAAGLPLNVHAGEAAGAESVAGAVHVLKAERIGHGIRLMENPELIRHFRDSGLPVDVSPTSNYCLGVVPRGTAHPIRAMLDAGVRCSVNSDDPGMFATSLINEYVVLHGQGFSRDELWKLNCRAIDASFQTPAEKIALKQSFAAWFESSKAQGDR